MATIQTVLGPIPASKLGFALPHEHVLCDFIGADKTGRHRWEVDAVVAAIRPKLEAVKARGVKAFFDCTPARIGRDPRILKRLAETTGLHLVTNTGYYGGAGDAFVPAHAYSESADQLAARWQHEWENGIEETGVRPGFVKIGVDEAPGDPPTLSEIDAKLVRAAALTSRRTGLAVTCHTGGASGGSAAARLFVAEKGDPARFIVAHSDGHGAPTNRELAALGVWISFDGFGWGPLEPHVEKVLPLIESFPGRLLLSMDSGWYHAGEPNGGAIRDYNFLPDQLLPALRQKGVDARTLRRLTVENPAKAFGIEPARSYRDSAQSAA